MKYKRVDNFKRQSKVKINYKANKMIASELKEKADVLKDQISVLINEFVKENGNCTIDINTTVVMSHIGDCFHFVELSVKVETSKI